MEQPQSLIPLSLKFAGPQRLFPQDIFPPAKGTLVQPTAQFQRHWRKSVYFDTREPVYIFPLFPSYNHKLQVPN